jgi:hypothetical protein
MNKSQLVWAIAALQIATLLFIAAAATGYMCLDMVSKLAALFSAASLVALYFHEHPEHLPSRQNSEGGSVYVVDY